MISLFLATRVCSGFLLTASKIKEYIQTVDSILDNYLKNIDDYQLTLSICVTCSYHQFDSFFILLLPFILKVLFMGINVIMVLLMKTLFITHVEQDTNLRESLCTTRDLWCTLATPLSL